MSPDLNPLTSVVAAESARLAAAGTDVIDLERLRTVVDSMVPFNNFVGVRITELSREHAVAELPVRDELLNHFGTVHAGALFLAAEVAGAGAFSGAMAPRVLQVQRFVLRESKVGFLKPASGRIRARATVDQQVVTEVLARRSAERFELTGTALLHDDAGLLVARVELDYVAWIAAA
ncbi:PaaI family thioesterase [Pseudonocardia xinjiangensis]|uniref:PaaI family thioesterase n=1 Tax=Pseudonocardia xinjiangensis TaxID=75289 RepID=A0ABX1R8Q0_9PSEU|nr:YiiD C-terminal domain-containing protein [Pseudonocardia xinjiangensis]NMH75829.1 PaaI family thioesterase [Pseudonocardia xinjiangensis]